MCNLVKLVVFRSFYGGILLSIISVTFLLFPLQKIAAADPIQDRCWLQENCESYNGIWGKSDNYKKLYGNGQADDWSQKFCDNIGADKVTARCFAGNPTLPLQVGIPGVTEKFCSSFNLGSEPTACKIDDDCKAKSLGTCQPGIKGGFPGYVAAFYKFFVGFMAVVAVVMIMWGGFKRIMAAGSAEKIKDANGTVFAAIIGLVLTLVSYTLLNLINPRLVANILPLMEKVRPEIFGFCPSYEKNKSLYEAGYLKFLCGSGKNVNRTCFTDDDCPPDGEVKGKCVERAMSFNNPGDNTCGKKMVFSGRECTGMECPSGQGCFKNQASNNPPYACDNIMLQGNLSGIRVNKMDAILVCNNGSVSGYNCGMKDANGTVSDNLDVKSKSSYVITGCWTPDTNSELKYRTLDTKYCENAGGLKGIALAIERESTGCDDWYIVDASSCWSVTKRVTDGDGNYVIWPHSAAPFCVYDLFTAEMNFQKVDKSKLFYPFDSDGKVKAIKCDINVTNKELPDL
ncbi:MAG: pilin [Patescibacteria group bacterium]